MDTDSASSSHRGLVAANRSTRATAAATAASARSRPRGAGRTPYGSVNASVMRAGDLLPVLAHRLESPADAADDEQGDAGQQQRLVEHQPEDQRAERHGEERRPPARAGQVQG